jgi:peroxiredoxin
MASATSFFDFTPKDSTSSFPHTSRPSALLLSRASLAEKGTPYPLSQHTGKVIFVVNTASKCGFTPQFTGLEALYKKISSKYPDQFVMLGIPCNQFNSQDPGSNDEIQEFCQVNYGVSFPVLGKTDVNGDKAEPVYEWMKSEKPGLLGLKRIKWNFEKFLIGRDGKVVQRWGSITKPENLESDILREIEKKGPVKSEL